MFRLSIITINFNNLEGLKKTVESILNQRSKEFEYVIIDGGSTDGSREFIEQTVQHETLLTIKWLSEKDNGIYHAMNKGIKLSSGTFVQFINSGDILVNDMVVSKMLTFAENEEQIVYGNMLKQLPKGLYCDKGFEGRKPTFLDFYYGTLNHSPTLIPRAFFYNFGFYDETLRIVSDWKWFLQVIIFENIELRYVDMDVTYFDMNGISNTNQQLEKDERKKVLEETIPPNILEDYKRDAEGMQFYRLIKTIPTGTMLFKLIYRIYAWVDRKFHNHYIKN